MWTPKNNIFTASEKVQLPKRHFGRLHCIFAPANDDQEALVLQAEASNLAVLRRCGRPTAAPSSFLASVAECRPTGESPRKAASRNLRPSILGSVHSRVMGLGSSLRHPPASNQVPAFRASTSPALLSRWCVAKDYWQRRPLMEPLSPRRTTDKSSLNSCARFGRDLEGQLRWQ